MPKSKDAPSPPDTSRPLHEPTIGRRIWALYLSKGYSRAQFATAIEVVYSMVVHWDHGTHEPRLQHLAKIAQQLDVALDDLVFGAAGRPKPTRKPPEDAAIMHALDSVNASPGARAAFAEHQASTAGKYQRFTYDYVQRFAQAFDNEIGAGSTPHQAAQVAFAEAVNKRAAMTALTAAPPAPSKQPSASRPALPSAAHPGSAAPRSSARRAGEKKQPSPATKK